MTESGGKEIKPESGDDFFERLKKSEKRHGVNPDEGDVTQVVKYEPAQTYWGDITDPDNEAGKTALREGWILPDGQETLKGYNRRKEIAEEMASAERKLWAAILDKYKGTNGATRAQRERFSPVDQLKDALTQAGYSEKDCKITVGKKAGAYELNFFDGRKHEGTIDFLIKIIQKDSGTAAL